jgi:hypothetical protein
MLKEVDAHTDKEHWEVWAKADVPAGRFGLSNTNDESMLERSASARPGSMLMVASRRTVQITGSSIRQGSTGFQSAFA